MYYLHYKTDSIGILTVTSNGESIEGVWFANDRFQAQRDTSDYKKDASQETLRCASEWLDSYFAGDKPDPAKLSLADNVTEFQLLVRNAMLSIPYGQTRTYGWIAQKIEQETGKPRSARAVGGAVGRNPLGIIVPCHRVVGSNGNLTGFGGGISTKIKLLEHEGCDMATLKMPRMIPAWNDEIDEANASLRQAPQDAC